MAVLSPEQLAALFKGPPERSGNSWFVFCPCHPDGQTKGRRSLSIFTGKGGDTYWKCLAGCDGDKVIAAIGKTWRDVRGREPSGKPGRAKGKKAAAPPLVLEDVFEYTTAAGDLAFEVTRFTPKTFKQRRPHPTIPGAYLHGVTAGWYVPHADGQWYRDKDAPADPTTPPVTAPGALYAEDAGVDTTPYALDRLAAMRPPRVVVVEGERCAEVFWACGIPATCNAGGATKWRDGHAKALKDCGVTELVVCPDHDEPGLKHSVGVADSAWRHGLGIRWLALPGLTDKQDVLDYAVARGLSWATLKAGTSDGVALHALEEDLAAQITALPVLGSRTDLPDAIKAVFGWHEPIPNGHQPSGEGLGHLRDGAIEKAPPEYLLRDGCFWKQTQTSDGWSSIELSQFFAWFTVEKSVYIDEVRPPAVYVTIEGRHKSGRPFPTIRDLPMAECTEMTWVPRHWGSRAIIHQTSREGTKQDVYQAMSHYSKGFVECENVYAHTGWRQFPGGWRFLSGNGAVGDASIKTLVTYHSGRIELPTMAEHQVEGMRAVIRAIRTLTADSDLAAAIFALPFRAACFSISPAPWSMMFVGASQSYKSSVAALVMSFFGRFPDRASLEVDFSSTEASLEGYRYTLKDHVVILDDYVPQGARGQDIAAKLMSIVRMQKNLAAKMRATRSMRKADDYPPRSIPLITGETPPSGESLLSSMITLSFTRDSIRQAALTQAQRDSVKGLYRHAMAGFVLWLGTLFEASAGLIVDARDKLRGQITEMLGGDVSARGSENLADLLVGLDMALRYAVEISAATESEREDLLLAALGMSQAIGRRNEEAIVSNRLELQVVTVLQAQVARGAVTLVPRGRALTSVPAMERPIGWWDEESIYLQGGGVSDILRALRESGVSVSIDETGLMAVLDSAGLILRQQSGHGRMRVVRGLFDRTTLARAYVLPRKKINELLGFQFSIPPPRGQENTSTGFYGNPKSDSENATSTPF